MNASEGNEPRKASSPLPFREAINNFDRNLSVIGKVTYKKNIHEAASLTFTKPMEELNEKRESGVIVFKLKSYLWQLTP